jgi:hypothetical protein
LHIGTIIMQTKEDLDTDIINITMKIQDTFPELSKYITEMPVKISDIKDPGVTLKNLKDYYNSLEALLKKYMEEHENKTA